MIYSFENGIPEGVEAKNSQIMISELHRKDGKFGLLWEREADAVLSLKGQVGYRHFKENGPDQNRDNFVLWIYREEAQQEALRISFHKKGRECCSFCFAQQFTGWRTCWVPFQDMDGQPEEDMDEIQLELGGSKACRVWLDQIITAVPIDPRHPVPDEQVSFVNLGVNVSVNAHWTSLLRFHKLEAEAKKEHITAGKEEVSCIALIEERLENVFLSHSPWMSAGKYAVTEAECTSLCEKYNRFELKKGADGLYCGLTIDSGCHLAAYPKENREMLKKLTGSVEVKECCQLLWETACAYHAADEVQRKKLSECYMILLQHLWEQGWTKGSSLGTTHHLGYPMRKLYPAVFLMREPLAETGLLEQAADMIGWFSGRGRIFRTQQEVKGESMDTLNTLLQGILASILLMPNTQEKVCCLRAMSRWLSHCLKPAPGLSGPFKTDGSVFHHTSHYPAYAMGGFQGVCPVVYVLSHTPFCLGEEAHRTLRKCLLYMRIYCNRYHWLVSMSARHPKGIGEMSRISDLEPFYYMALAGEPGCEGEDREMAEALLRLAEYMDFPAAEYFRKQGYKAEKAPEGHFTMNYACAGIHRRKEWMAGVRGHSRYLWANETYEKNNLYGRYITYGCLQILGSGEPVNNTDSGFFQEGWNWNYFPGTTSVVLPWKELKQRVCVVDKTAGFEEMLLSDEAFAGGVNLWGRQGAFAMKLHGHAKYDGSLRARKSWFFFNDRILCLGSSVQDARKEYATVTTLYQYYLGSKEETAQDSFAGGLTEEQKKSVVTVLDQITEAELTLTDPGGNRYHVPTGYHIKVTRGLQESRAQDSGEPTWAYYETAWIDHGNAPEGSGYEYMIHVQPVTNVREGTQTYQIIQKDEKLHEVYEKESGIYGYVFFEDGMVSKDSQGAVLSVDRPCLVMEHKTGIYLDVSFSDPDLRFYEGQEQDQLNPDGTQKEVSLYSREWLRRESIGKWTTVTLKGYWELTKDCEFVRLSVGRNCTELIFWGQDGCVREVNLREKDK